MRMEIFDNQIPVFGAVDDRTLNQIRVCARTADKVALMPAGKVTPEMMRAWVDRARIELRGAGLDESPDCYSVSMRCLSLWATQFASFTVLRRSVSRWQERTSSIRTGLNR
jgi:hypothetical protein